MEVITRPAAGPFPPPTAEPAPDRDDDPEANEERIAIMMESMSAILWPPQAPESDRWNPALVKQILDQAIAIKELVGFNPDAGIRRHQIQAMSQADAALDGHQMTAFRAAVAKVVELFAGGPGCPAP